MKALKQPIEPRKPHKPEKPSPTHKQNTSHYLGGKDYRDRHDYKYSSLQDILNDCPEGVSLGDISLEVDVQHGYYDSIDTYIHAYYTVAGEVPNPWYKDEMKRYEKDLAKYEKELAEYPQKLEEYKVKKLEYDVWRVQQDEIDAARHLAIAEGNYKKAQARAEKLKESK